MSEDLFYNRDRNISGITAPDKLTGLELTPSYGSTATFRSQNNAFNTDDFYYELVPLSVNNLSAEFKMNYELSPTNAAKVVNFFEAQSGYKQFEFNPDNSGIYKVTTGFCDQYDVNFVSNQHADVKSTISVDGSPTFFNWSGGNFTNIAFNGWAVGSGYKKYDLVYSGVHDCQLDNFYYCTGDHTANEANSPTGTGAYWSSRNFFFEPNIQQNAQVGIKADILEFKNSFRQRLGGNAQTKNIAKFDISYNFTDISDKQARAMLHFLENKGGYRRFRHQIPSVYDRPKVYYCPEWTHTWKYINSNDLQVSFVEDPLGVIPTGA
jgi:phage-related protein